MKSDYYIVTMNTRVGLYPRRWELRRRSEPMGIKVGSSGFQSQAMAEFAGAQALVRFLEDLNAEVVAAARADSPREGQSR